MEYSSLVGVLLVRGPATVEPPDVDIAQALSAPDEIEFLVAVVVTLAFAAPAAED